MWQQMDSSVYDELWHPHLVEHPWKCGYQATIFTMAAEELRKEFEDKNNIGFYCCWKGVLFSISIYALLIDTRVVFQGELSVLKYIYY